jgi:hypothetical protein
MLEGLDNSANFVFVGLFALSLDDPPLSFTIGYARPLHRLPLRPTSSAFGAFKKELV